MKDYSIRDREKDDYILKCWKSQDGTYNVKFADGTVFRKIAANDKNIEKIIEQQEIQAKRAISRYDKFEKRAAKDKAISVLGGVASFTGSTVLAATIPVITNNFNNMNGALTVMAGIGVITILGTIPGSIKLKKSRAKVSELDKIKYRDEHIEKLEMFREYQNALQGLDLDTISKLEHSKEPFSILNIDNYSLEDLKTIIKNINREDNLQFTYVKTK